ncbi:MAG: hypothetical protein ACI4T6_10090, partial [Candidatus Flemingiibacterium sp.]
MNLLENLKPTFKTASGETFAYEKGRCAGKYGYKSEKLTSSLAVSQENIDGLYAVRVKASVKGDKFNADCAVALGIPSLGELEGYFGNYQSCNHWCSAQFGDDISKLNPRTQALL